MKTLILFLTFTAANQVFANSSKIPLFSKAPINWETKESYFSSNKNFKKEGSRYTYVGKKKLTDIKFGWMMMSLTKSGKLEGIATTGKYNNVKNINTSLGKPTEELVCDETSNYSVKIWKNKEAEEIYLITDREKKFFGLTFYKQRPDNSSEYIKSYADTNAEFSKIIKENCQNK